MAAAELTLRRATLGDAAAIAAIYAYYVETSIVTFETAAPDAATMARRTAAVLGAGLPWLIAERGGEVAGYAYAARFHPREAYRFTVEPTVYCASDAVGLGIGAALYDRLLAILEELGYHQAIALVSQPNAASDALHRRLGFGMSGRYDRAGYKFNRWIDVALYQRTLAPMAEDEPLEPLPLAQSRSWTALP